MVNHPVFAPLSFSHCNLRNLSTLILKYYSLLWAIARSFLSWLLYVKEVHAYLHNSQLGCCLPSCKSERWSHWSISQLLVFHTQNIFLLCVCMYFFFFFSSSWYMCSHRQNAPVFGIFFLLNISCTGISIVYCSGQAPVRLMDWKDIAAIVLISVFTHDIFLLYDLHAFSFSLVIQKRLETLRLFSQLCV